MTDSFEQISAHNEELARHIVERASARGVTVSTAESLTAGMIASTIADIPGASAVLRGGAVTYCDEIKHRVLGVDQETLDRYTAVSHQTAREMAAGSLELYQSDIAVSATGYAGPGGGTPQKPVGLVYIALSDEENIWVRVMRPQGRYLGREWTRRLASSHALDMLRRCLAGLPVEDQWGLNPA